MDAYIYYGKLKKSLKKIESLFELLEWDEKIIMGAGDFLGCADEYFGSRTAFDWGSFYWKCKKADLIKFSKEKNVEVSSPKLSSDTEQYGVVFIEMS